jgi:hypothetical protein
VLRCAACRPSEKCGEIAPLAPVASSASSVDARCSTSPTAGARRRRSQRGGAGRASPAGARRRRSSTCLPHSAAAQDALPRPELAGERLQRGGGGRCEATFFALIILVKVPLLFKITSPSQWLGSLVIYPRVTGSKPRAQIFSSFNSTLIFGPICQRLQPLPCQQRDWKKEYDVWASVVSQSSKL